MRLQRVLAGVVLVAALLVAPGAPAQAATNGFRGVNWADERDNFVNDILVLGGLSTSDSYATTQAKANGILTGFQNNLGANTVRMPVNHPTVSGAYWNSYTGAIDMASSKGMRVILSYWESSADRDGTVDDLPQFWSMWQTIVNQVCRNANVYFEPFNEPYAYSDADWKNLAAEWLSRHSGVPRGRVIISGAGYNQRLTTIGGDTRFDGTLISRHTYQFFDTSRLTEDSWRESLRTSVGAYADRVLITEFGAPMTDGRNYNAPTTTDSFVAFIRGTAAEARSLGLGTVYWPRCTPERLLPPPEHHRQRNQPVAHHDQRLRPGPVAVLLGPGRWRQRDAPALSGGQPQQRPGDGPGRLLHREQRRGQAVRLERRPQPAVGVRGSGHRIPQDRQPLQRQVRRCGFRLHRRRRQRHPVRLRLRHEPAVAMAVLQRIFPDRPPGTAASAST